MRRLLAVPLLVLACAAPARAAATIADFGFLNSVLTFAGSYSWAGINNTHFWVDPTRQIGVIVLMRVLPFYDDRAIGVLTGLETLVNTHAK